MLKLEAYRNTLSVVVKHTRGRAMQRCRNTQGKLFKLQLSCVSRRNGLGFVEHGEGLRATVFHWALSLSDA